MLSTIELGRFQTEANIVKELGVFILVCVEKVPELEDDVVKKIVHHDVLFLPSEGIGSSIHHPERLILFCR